MRWPFPRRPGPPASALTRLDRHERVLAWAETADGDAVVATPAGLWLPGHDRVSWHLINHVVWTGTTLAVTAADEVEPGVLDNRPPVSVRLTEPQNLPETVQQRFYSSRTHTTQHAIPGGGSVIVVARRVAGVDGLRWYAVYDDPGQRHDPTAQAAVARLLAEAAQP